jgi:TusE/DsrC/DsvC family sulfur relay protein
MPVIELEGRTLEVNDEGFLANPAEWDRAAAGILARKEEGIETLTEKHWAVVNFIRAYYLDKGMAPMVRLMCKTTGLPLKEIYQLFPSGPAKGACKVAGLPKPDGCV